MAVFCRLSSVECLKYLAQMLSTQRQCAHAHACLLRGSKVKVTYHVALVGRHLFPLVTNTYKFHTDVVFFYNSLTKHLQMATFSNFLTIIDVVHSTDRMSSESHLLWPTFPGRSVSL